MFRYLIIDTIVTRIIITFGLECNCNTYGTIDCSSSCADDTGVCTCDSSRYSGDKCDESISGFSMNSDMISNGISKSKLYFLDPIFKPCLFQSI